jgi:hypothetical protein
VPLAVDFQGGVTSAWSKVITFVPKLAAALVTILVDDPLRAFCQHHGLNCTEASLFGFYADAVRHLHAVGAPRRLAVAE